jgi:hypothetical protein
LAINKFLTFQVPQPPVLTRVAGNGTIIGFGTANFKSNSYEHKKNPKYNFERKRFAFFQVGLIAAGTMVLVAFRWASPIDKEDLAENDLRDFRKEIPIEYDRKA